jgi:hypothetical protein
MKGVPLRTSFLAQGSLPHKSELPGGGIHFPNNTINVVDQVFLLLQQPLVLQSEQFALSHIHH